MDPTFSLETDPSGFRDRVWPFLASDSVLRTLPMTIVDAVVSGLYEASVLASVESPDGTVTGCAIQTPPHYLIVAATTEADVHALVGGLRAHGVDLPGVVGLTPWAHEFAAAWCDGTPASAAEDRASRLFRLDALIPPRPADGSARPATPEDLDLVVEWLQAFAREVGGIASDNPRRSLLNRILAGRIRVWETEQAAVSFLGHSPALGGHARIGPVYTPPERRGVGFASNLVADVSEELLQLGVVPTLFTDQANPTSNAIYQAIGYRPVADSYELRFVS